MEKEELKLQNKKALITGGSRGLGKQIAISYIAAGADVCICARNKEELSKALSDMENLRVFPAQKVVGLPADIANDDDVDRLFDFSQEQLSGLDVLVNNAGIQGEIGLFMEADWKRWKETFAVNLYGTANCIRHAIKYFSENARKGKIINLSGGGATGSRPYFSAYAASKTAIVRLTEIIADEMREFGICVNAIAPGAMNTAMTQEVIIVGKDVAGEKEYNSAKVRLNEDDSVMNKAARLAVYLGSDLADGISGRLLSAVWDDWEHLHEHKEEIMKSNLYTLRRIVRE